MTPILDALARGFRDLFQFRVLWIVIWPMLAAVLLWMVLGWVFWGAFSGWIASSLAAINIQSWLNGVEPRWIANAILAMMHLILFVPVLNLFAPALTGLVFIHFGLAQLSKLHQQ
ncbi:MAG: EI24 domain-containing protein [Gallionella sp.]